MYIMQPLQASSNVGVIIDYVSSRVYPSAHACMFVYCVFMRACLRECAYVRARVRVRELVRVCACVCARARACACARVCARLRTYVHVCRRAHGCTRRARRSVYVRVRLLYTAVVQHKLYTPLRSRAKLTLLSPSLYATSYLVARSSAQLSTIRDRAPHPSLPRSLPATPVPRPSRPPFTPPVRVVGPTTRFAPFLSLSSDANCTIFMTRRRLAHSPPTPPRLCTRGSGQKLISNLLLMGVRGISTQTPGAASAPKTMTDQVYMDDDRIVAGRKTTALCR